MHWSGGGQFDPAFGLVNGPVKSRSKLVKLGQTWSNLVKVLRSLRNVSRTTFWGFFGYSGPQLVQEQLGQISVKLGQSSPDSGKCIPDYILGGFFGYGGPPVGSETAWSNLGQTWSTLVKFGQPWENLVGFREMCPRPCFEVI